MVLVMEVVASRTGVSAPARLFSGELALSLSYRALLVAIAVGPASSSFALAGRGSDWTREPLLRFVDAPLLVIAALQLVPVLARVVRSFRRSASGVAFAALAGWVGWVGLSWAVQGRAIGGLMVLRLVAALGIADLVVRVSASRRVVVLKTLIGLVVFEGLVCLAQLMVDGPIGLGALGEAADPFNRLGPWRAPMGTSYYPYPLSAVALLTLGLVLWAIDRSLIGRVWGVAAALGAGVIIGSGYSVVGAAIVVAIALAFVVRAVPSGVGRFRGVAGLVLVVFLGTLAVTGASLSEGWLWKGERSTSPDTAQASSGRADQIRIGVAVTKKWPLFGIGPGNFAVMRERYPEFNKVSTDAQIPHSMPVLVAVEAGVPALLFFALAVGAALWRRFRRSIVLVMAMSGYVAGDLMHWYTGFGVMQVGLWLGFLLMAREDAAQA
jgi:hypothetical protein